MDRRKNHARPSSATAKHQVDIKISTQVTRLECYSEAASLSQVFPRKLQGSSAYSEAASLSQLFPHKSQEFAVQQSQQDPFEKLIEHHLETTQVLILPNSRSERWSQSPTTRPRPVLVLKWSSTSRMLNSGQRDGRSPLLLVLVLSSSSSGPQPHGC